MANCNIDQTALIFKWAIWLKDPNAEAPQMAKILKWETIVQVVNAKLSKGSNGLFYSW